MSVVVSWLIVVADMFLIWVVERPVIIEVMALRLDRAVYERRATLAHD
jgi:hypothetical protein